MLPRNFRLNLKTHFKWVAAGDKQETPFFKIFLRFGENTEAKIGVALSKNFFKKAVERSKTKRLVFGIVSVLYPLFKKNLNLVIIPKTRVFSVSKEVLMEDLKKLRDIYKNE